MRLGFVGKVKVPNRSYLDSHACESVVGKEALVFNDFNRKVDDSGYDPSGETNSMWIVSAALGCVIPQTEKTVIVIIHQGIHLTHLEHNLVSTI
jgi:hypothetical protein